MNILHRYLPLMLALAALAHTGCGSAQKAQPERKIAAPVPSPDAEYAPSTLIIFYDATVGKKPLLKAIKKYGAEVIYDYRTFNGMAIRIPDDKDIHRAMDYFQQVKGVLTVNRDRVVHLHDPVRPRLEVKDTGTRPMIERQ